MVDSALSANRALATLDWFVGHPGQAFTLSELSRALAINIPSLMAVLKSLTDRGYLIRHAENKSYEPGPALIAVGVITSARHPAFHRLAEELEELAAEVGNECFASVAIADQSIVVAEAGRPSSYSPPIKVGFRFPIIAPNGHVFVAWSSPAEIEDWIRRADLPSATVDRVRMTEELAVVRRYGCSVVQYGTIDFEPAAALEMLAKDPDDPARREAVKTAVANFTQHLTLLQPRSGETYESLNIAAPVFGPTGKVIMAIVINGLPKISGDDLLGCMERLARTTRLLTKQGGGFPPRG
jgi:DNA-binding IclR family transcriptional regulator